MYYVIDVIFTYSSVIAESQNFRFVQCRFFSITSLGVFVILRQKKNGQKGDFRPTLKVRYSAKTRFSIFKDSFLSKF